VIVCENIDSKGNSIEKVMGSFILPNVEINHNESLNNFQVPLSVIEQSSGLLFFENVDVKKEYIPLCKIVECVVNDFKKQIKH
jgi:DNA/RNA endonuclease G (NUC1)